MNLSEDPLPLLNLETVQSIIDIAGPGDRFAFELYEVFIAQSENVLRELKAAATSCDTNQSRNLAHRLKGSAANLGAVALSHKASALEQKLMSEVIPKDLIIQSASELEALFQATRLELISALKRC